MRIATGRLCPAAILFVLAAPVAAADKPLVGPPASWVKTRAVPPAAGEPGSAAVAMLMSDRQLRFSGETTSTFVEEVVRIQTPQGLSALGTFAIQWKPETDTVTVHKLHIRRGAVVIDVLGKGQEFTILRRENNLEYAALDGILTATIQPEGLQVGDIVDMAYTLDRTEPLVKGHGDQIVTGLPGLPIERMTVAASWDKGRPMRVRMVDAPGKPSLNGADGFELTADKVPPLMVPAGAPSRFRWGRQFEFSDYGSWAELAAVFAPLYDQARRLKADSPLMAQVAKIRAASVDPVKRAEAALALVQDQVRYVYLGANDGNLRPAEADATWQRRFGDCKGKTALLLALLDALEVPAEAALVSMQAGDGMDERLPMGGPFDHVIVRATIEGRTYWLDGTRTGDTALARLKVPAFGWALPLRTRDAKLQKLVVPPADQPDSVTDIKLDASGGISVPAKVHAEIRFTGDGATGLRLQLANLTPQDLEQGLRTYWTKAYDFMTPERVSAHYDPTTGVELLTMDGTAKMDWNRTNGGYYEMDGGTLGWRPDYARVPGPHSDAPFALAYPSYTLTRETIQLPGSGGFRIDGADVDQTLAGYRFTRKTRLEGSVVTMEASTRSLVPEISRAEAEASVEPMRTLAKRGVYVNLAPTYQGTAADNDAVFNSAPDTALGHMERARARFRQRRPKDALPELDAVIARDPKLVDAWSARSWIRNALGDEDAALKDADQALTLNPQDPTALGVKIAILERRDIAAARALVDQALARTPADTTMLMRRASLRRRTGDSDGALADAEAAIKITPTADDAYLLRANIWRQRGDLLKTTAEADRLLRAAPDDPNALTTVGAILIASGRKEDAMRAFDRALSIRPDASTYLTRANNRSRSDVAGRRSDVDTALKLDPNVQGGLFMLADLQIKQGDRAGAISTIEKFDSPVPLNDRAALTLAALRARAGQTEIARRSMQEIRGRNLKNAVMLNELCWEAATSNFDLETALADCKASLALAPDNMAARDSLGFVLLRLGRYAEAIAAYDAAIALAPQGPSLFGRGVARKAIKADAAGEADLAAARKQDSTIDETFKAYGITG